MYFHKELSWTYSLANDYRVLSLAMDRIRGLATCIDGLLLMETYLVWRTISRNDKGATTPHNLRFVLSIDSKRGFTARKLLSVEDCDKCRQEACSPLFYVYLKKIAGLEDMYKDGV